MPQPVQVRRKRYAELKRLGLCTYCKKPLGDESGRHAECRTAEAARVKKNRQVRVRNGVCANCGGTDVVGSWACRNCCDRLAVNSQELRCTVILHYSPESRCACCGQQDIRFLTIDHMDDDGETWRSAHGASGATLYRWIIDNGFPKNLQILCFSCNSGRYLNGGVCPHKDDNFPVMAAVPEERLAIYMAGLSPQERGVALAKTVPRKIRPKRPSKPSELGCIRCSAHAVTKAGKQRGNGKQRYNCKNCGKFFVLPE